MSYPSGTRARDGPPEFDVSGGDRQSSLRKTCEDQPRVLVGPRNGARAAVPGASRGETTSSPLNCCAPRRTAPRTPSETMAAVTDHGARQGTVQRDEVDVTDLVVHMA